ncbi:MAG: hypothetical protein Q8M66_09335 [Actinomycetota bacterium]|nr:hypothetical protein [Actinomycetota bacterium]
MKHITLSPDQHIELQAAENANLFNAITEAISMAAQHPGCSFDLTYNGFLFAIEHDSDAESLIDEYSEWVCAAQETTSECLTE